MKKAISILCILLATVLVFVSCGEETLSKGTKNAKNYYSTSINSVIKMPTNNTELSTSLRKGDTCKYGTYEKRYDPTADDGFWSLYADGWKGIVGLNESGVVYVVKTQKIENCIIWIDSWTQHSNAGDTTLSNVSESQISNTIKSSISVGGSYASLNCETLASQTQKEVSSNQKNYKYNLEDYDTENYEYAWAEMANVYIYRYDYYRKRTFGILWGEQYQYKGCWYEVVIDESNPNRQRELLYRESE